MKKAGNGIARTRAFPSTTWERGEGTSYNSFSYNHGSDCPSDQDVDKGHNHQYQEQSFKAGTGTSSHSRIEVTTVEGASEREPWNRSRWQRQIWDQIKGCFQYKYEQERKCRSVPIAPQHQRYYSGTTNAEPACESDSKCGCGGFFARFFRFGFHGSPWPYSVLATMEAKGD
jgi:hypothetical protein